MDILLIILLLLFLFGGLGAWPGWGWHHAGYFPSGLLWVIAIICLVVFLRNRGRA